MKEITVKWLSNSDLPLYQQLYHHFKTEISSGRLSFGTRLPSKKQLETSLNVSQTTIETAYSQLQAEGYIESVARRGFFVAARDELSEFAKAEPINREKEGKPIPVKWTFDFSPGQIDTTGFPFQQWRKLYRQAIDFDNRHQLMLGCATGEPELREQIRKYLYESRGVVCQANQIIIGAGIEQLLPQLVILLGPKTVFGIENPGYPLTRHVLDSYQRVSILIDVDDEGADVNHLETTSISTMYVTPSHQFPIGSIMSVNRRVRLLNWAARKVERYIIEDDYDSEFRYFGRPIPSLYSMSEGQKVIYLSTFSKSLMPSLRIGYMVLPPQLLERYRKEFSHYASCVSRIDQNILASFMDSCGFARHLNKMRNSYRKKVEIILNKLNETDRTFNISGETAGLHMLLNFPETTCEKSLIEAAASQGIRVCGLSRFYHEAAETQKPGIVLGFGNLSEDELSEGLHSLLSCWRA
ncbi:MAG: PLP-dependent aminotransferase family protein [Candidatus Riflebacteria bacterium]